MTISRHTQFIPADDLHVMHQELLSSAGWVFREKFWRYYLIPGLRPYNEFDTATWYHNQPGALERIKQPWKRMFDCVLNLAGADFQLMRYALTGQTQNQMPDLHKDVETTDQPGQWRSYLLYLNTEYHQHWGGPTEIQMADGSQHLEWPEPGKLIEFDSQLLHIGHPPEVPNVLRLTIVLHGYTTCRDL